MFDGYRVIVVCPAGRRHVADLMRRHVEQARPVVDKVHWWLNTEDPADLAYFRGLSRAAPDFYRTIAHSGPVWYGRRHMLIGRFFTHTIDPMTIYVRVDDDVIWMTEGCIQKLVAHRVKYQNAYLVYGNIVNSSRFMHLHQKHGAFDPGFAVSYEINHSTNRGSIVAGLAAHEALLDTAEAITDGGDRETLLAPWTKFGRHVFAAGEHNDNNMLAWFGRDFAVWKGICPRAVHEEQWICLRMPAQFGSRIHEACGDALCAHYASAPQWNGITDHPQILARYAKLAPPTDIVPVLAAPRTVDAVS